MKQVTAAIDHLVYGVPELSVGIVRMAELLGVAAAPVAAMKGVVATTRYFPWVRTPTSRS